MSREARPLLPAGSPREEQGCGPAPNQVQAEQKATGEMYTGSLGQYLLYVALGLQSFVVQALPRMPCLRPGLGTPLGNSPSHHSDVRLSLC